MSAKTPTATGYLHSVQTLGTLDGPGVRFVAFTQGCPLRCACCHNPDTWQLADTPAACAAPLCITPAQLLQQVLRYRPFFGAQGGITVSGGEPLLQLAFVTQLFRLCRQHNIHTCLDTSGCVLTPETADLLAVTDLVLLDIKYTTEEQYRRYVGCSYAAPLAFLAAAQARQIPVWLRQVSIPGINEDSETLHRLAALAAANPCVKKVQLLPFRKLCVEKYETLGISFPFSAVPEADPAHTAERQAQLNACLQHTGQAAPETPA